MQRALRLGAAGAVACGVCGYFATRARGSEAVPASSLLHSTLNDKTWARAFWVSVPSIKVLKLGPEYAEGAKGSNAVNVHTEALFSKFAAAALNSETFTARCQRVAMLKGLPGPDDKTPTLAATAGSTIVVPEGRHVKVARAMPTELVLRDESAPVVLWLAVREKKPEWVGDAHTVEFHYGTALDRSECGAKDYLVYLFDVWQARRVLNEASKRAMTRPISL